MDMDHRLNLFEYDDRLFLGKIFSPVLLNRIVFSFFIVSFTSFFQLFNLFGIHHSGMNIALICNRIKIDCRSSKCIRMRQLFYVKRLKCSISKLILLRGRGKKRKFFTCSLFSVHFHIQLFTIYLVENLKEFSGSCYFIIKLLLYYSFLFSYLFFCIGPTAVSSMATFAVAARRVMMAHSSRTISNISAVSSINRLMHIPAPLKPSSMLSSASHHFSSSPCACCNSQGN